MVFCRYCVARLTLVFFLLSRNHFYVPFILICTYVVSDCWKRLVTIIPTSFSIRKLHNYYTHPLHVWVIVSYLHPQEAQLLLTNTRNAFRVQSRSTNMVPLRVFATAIWNSTTWPWIPDQGSLKVIETGTIQRIGHGFLIVFYRNFIPKTHHFQIFTFEKYRDRETGLTGYWRSLKMILFDIVTLKSGSRSLKVIEIGTIR